MKTEGLMKTIRSILLLAGAFTFSFLLGEMVHDSGHYFCHLAHGNHQVQVHFDPFGGTHISGANGLPDHVLGVTSAAGPMTNLILGLVSFFLLWRVRRPVLLPFLLWGPVAMIQEGVTFSLGLLTPGGDGQWIMVLGIPQAFILMTGIFLLIAGMIGITLLLPLAGIKVDDSPRQNFMIILVSMCSLMLVRSAHAVLVAPGAVMENLIPLVFSLLLAAIISLSYRKITQVAGKFSITEPALVAGSAAALALILGAGMFALQLFLLK